jgi:hypothetical protein
MRFMIHGADQKTGREMTVVMEAPDESEAERRALYNDILVSSVARFTAGAAAGVEPRKQQPIDVEPSHGPDALALTYQPAEFPPEVRGSGPPHPAAAVPRYREVLCGARWLDRVGLLARWGGGLAILAGIALILIALVDPIRQWLAIPAHPVLFLIAAGVLSVLGVLCVVSGVMISMTSGLVVAVRDIAQNTFHVAARSSPADIAPETAVPALSPAPARGLWVLPADVLDGPQRLAGPTLSVAGFIEAAPR